MKTKSQAEQAYAEAASRVTALVAEVQQKLADHAKRQQADPNNWGLVGDLQHYEELLSQILGRHYAYDAKGNRVRITIPGRDKEGQ